MSDLELPLGKIKNATVQVKTTVECEAARSSYETISCGKRLKRR
jgi:hypothetical protein